MPKRRTDGFGDALAPIRVPRPAFARCFADDEPAGGAPGAEPDRPDGDEAFAAERQQLVAESRKYRKRAQEAEAEAARLERLVLPAEQLAEYRELKAAGERRGQADDEAGRQYDRLVAELTDKHGRELAEAGRAREALEARLCELVGADRLKSVLAARRVRRVDQAAYLLARHVRVSLADGKPVVQVVDDRGEPIAAPGGEPGETVGMEAFVDAWLAEAGAHFLPPSGDTGSGAHRGAAGERADVAEMEADPARRYAFIREHGTDEYLRRLGAWKRRQAAGK